MKKKYRLILIILTITFISLIAIQTITSRTPTPPPCIKRTKVVNATAVPVHIILNAIPKSASLYIMHMLEIGLHAPYMPVANGYFPNDVLSYDFLQSFYESQSAISKTHLSASTTNIMLFKKFADRAIVQFRDPREVLLSWTHYLQRIFDENKLQYLYYVDPTPPLEYYTWEFTRQIDWNIDNFLPEVVKWMQSWVEFQDDTNKSHSGFKVLITTYDDFKKNELQFYYNILDFYDIPRSQFMYIPQKLDMNLHFRRGDQNEWRQIYTRAQMQKINQILPSKLMQRFNWK